MVRIGGREKTLKVIESVKSEEIVKGQEIVRQCPDCGSEDIDYLKEEFYCKKCGLVLD